MYSTLVTNLRNHLKRHRLNAGLSQGDLANLAGISRQAYSAVESGKAGPSTEVALRLAKCLGTGVDSLFSLADGEPEATEAELVGTAADLAEVTSDFPRRTRLWRVGRRLLARPVSGVMAARHSLVDAEGVILPEMPTGNRVAVRAFDDAELRTPALAMLGCDPAAALLELGLGRYGVRLISIEEGSRMALSGLASGEAHIAGCHLKDEDSGVYNHSWVSRLVPFPCTLVTFAAWQQGLMVTPGNPKGITGVRDLMNPEIAIINREPGSGSRSLLDRLLRRHDIPPSAIAGYEREAGGHLAVARAIALGQADAGVGVQAAATALELGFVPLEEERYDLVIPDHFLDEPGVQALLDLMRQPGLRRRVEALGGYDASGMGSPAAAA